MEKDHFPLGPALMRNISACESQATQGTQAQTLLSSAEAQAWLELLILLQT